MILRIEQAAVGNKEKGDWFCWTFKNEKYTAIAPYYLFFAHDFRSWFLKIMEGKE